MERSTERSTALFTEDPLVRRLRCERCGSRESEHVRLLVTGGCTSCTLPRAGAPHQSIPGSRPLKDESPKSA